MNLDDKAYELWEGYRKAEKKLGLCMRLSKEREVRRRVDEEWSKLNDIRIVIWMFWHGVDGGYPYEQKFQDFRRIIDNIMST